jgi:hypothetical protein
MLLRVIARLCSMLCDACLHGLLMRHWSSPPEKADMSEAEGEALACSGRLLLQALPLFSQCTTSSLGLATTKVYGEAWAAPVLNAIHLLSTTQPMFCGVVCVACDWVHTQCACHAWTCSHDSPALVACDIDIDYQVVMTALEVHADALFEWAANHNNNRPTMNNVLKQVGTACFLYVLFMMNIHC